MPSGDQNTKKAKPIITADDIIHEAVDSYPDLPHDKAVSKWLSTHYPLYVNLFIKANKKYNSEVESMGDVALYYAVTKMIEEVVTITKKGSPKGTTKEVILLLLILIPSYVISWFLILETGLLGIMLFVAVNAAILVFILSFEKGWIRKKEDFIRKYINQ